MKKHSQIKRVYASPSVIPTQVMFEQALLVTTARFLLEVDETDNVNARTTGADAPGGEMYFEF